MPSHRVSVLAACITACGGTPSPADDTTSSGSTTATTGAGSEAASSSGAPRFDLPPETDGPASGCVGDGDCVEIDVLFVIDNSGTMGEEQLGLAANFPRLIEQLQDLTDPLGNPIHPSVNIMVTNTDFGHPRCTGFEKPDYDPRQGAPVYDGCNARINRFTGLSAHDPLHVEAACTTYCPTDIAPADPFIHFDANSANVPGGPSKAAAALSCIGPQGIDGCGYEAPLEVMLHALNPDACWNRPDTEACRADPEWGQLTRGFLRPGAILAIAIVTDEEDCSVAAPDGYSYFADDGDHRYWEHGPGGSPEPSSAICWNAGVTCTGPDANGLYLDCVASDSGVLHPVSRYQEFLRYLVDDLDKTVVMLGVLGVPEVTEHSALPPYQPVAGGVEALVYRAWQDADLTPEEVDDGVTVADKVFEFGDIAPGCVSRVGDVVTGSAVPPVRVKEVCESLDVADDPATPDVDESVPRCCIESICDDDFSAAMRCLTGSIASVIPPAG